MLTRKIICNKVFIIGLLPDWIEDTEITHKIAKIMELDDEIDRVKRGFPNHECKGYFHVHDIVVMTDREAGKILQTLL